MATDAELLAMLDGAMAESKPGERGPQGNQGNAGVGIQNIEQTGEDSFDVNLSAHFSPLYASFSNVLFCFSHFRLTHCFIWYAL